MKFKLLGPCSECPFRSDIGFYLREACRKEIAEGFLNDGTFACHKTLDGEWDDEGVYQSTGNEQHCGGALVVLNKPDDTLLRANAPIRFAVIVGWLDPADLKMDAPVFESLDAFTKGN